MGKKKKKNKYFSELVESSYSGKKKSKGSNAKELKKAKKSMKTVHSTLTKKEAKANRKEMDRPIEVDKAFMKRRYRCNHATKMISVNDYFEKYDGKAHAYTSMATILQDVFGDDNVSICKNCFEAVVNRDCVNTDKVREALAMLYAACGIVVSNVRMDKDEVRKINALKDIVPKFRPVIEFMSELEEQDQGDNASASVADLNSNLGIDVD